MTFGQLQTAVYQVCGFSTPVQPPVVGRVKNWINEAHRHCLRLPGLVELRQRSNIPFTSIAGRDLYAFPFAYERIEAVVEQTTHRRLRLISRDVFRSIDPAETATGTPTGYVPEGWRPTTSLSGPPTGAIWAVSTWPLDTTQLVRIKAIRNVGDIRDFTLALNGTTPVSSINADFVDIMSFSLSSVCTGDVILFAGSELAPTTQELARIPLGLTFAQYWCLRLWPTPSGAILYHVDGQIEIPELIHETDVPMLPPSFHDLLAAFARMREYERTGDTRFAVASAEYERGLGQLRASVNFPDDWKPVAGSLPGTQPGSNLGGNYPADWTWP